MIERTASCGCNKTNQIKPNQSFTPIINNCVKTPKIAHIEGKGDYEVHALVDTDKGQAFLPVTSTKAVFDECGNNLDSILKKLQDVLAEFNKTNTKFQDCNGNVHNLEMVLNCNVKVVDDFDTDSGAKALSARRGKILYDALNSRYSDLSLQDAEDGSLALKIKDDRDLRQQIIDLSDSLNQYTQQSNILFSLLTNLVKPSLITVAKELSSNHIINFEENGNQVYCSLGFEWDLDTPNIEVIAGITRVNAILKWYDTNNNELRQQFIGEPDLTPGSRSNPYYAYTPIPHMADHATIQVVVYYGELPLTSDKVTYYLQREYNWLEDFRLIGVDKIVGIDLDDIIWESKLEDGIIYTVDMHQQLHPEEAPKIDTLYYSKTKMAEMGKTEVDLEVPLYYFNKNRELVQVQINRT